ncbi:MAG TPA: hypothetical protein PKW06_06265 [Cyclobacteriaceae bacterium]|nr:hypothetical protein [Cyclobacteriaceae bacterium]MCB9237822.1 hypothetical protein [Flammeovirgaceae bacterium]MCB0498666.1 hypothetical protein [Cyclobacteriaceae bacterium]MCO5270075.1 hypothetical protein [Cyclobacteriaceae bacterium]MCW5903185.1 hypothetical protein [Cyclobacteriaceae bacterium]
METYSENAKSGVHLYETGDDYITIRFHNASYDYKFTYESAGQVAVEVMKKLAAQRSGLSTYISTQVKDRYASKTPVKGDDKTHFMNIKFE